MSRSLAERLADATGGPVDFDGRSVTMLYEFDPIGRVTDFELELRASEDRPQGVRLKARGGDLVINGERMTDAVLWSDTAPPTIAVRAVPKKGASVSLKLWNAWRDANGTIHAWSGEAGLAVDSSSDDEVVIVASDGLRPVEFENLRVVVRRRAPADGPLEPTHRADA